MLVRLIGLLGVGWWLATPTHAQDLPLPAWEYPPHTKLTYYPDWTNQQFDCNFGWFCDGGIDRPFFHVSTEDALHRTGGWVLWGEWQGDRMGFELYSSVYSDHVAPDSIAWNRYAAADEQGALLAFQQGKTAKSVPSVLPSGVQGAAFAIYLNRADWHLLFLTAWWGDCHEIEAAVLYPLKKKWEARG